MTRLYRWLKRLLGFYRNRRGRRQISHLGHYVAYFTRSPQWMVARDREVK